MSLFSDKGEIQMTNRISDISLRSAALITGVAILIMTLAAVVATDLTIGSLIVQDDAAATTNNIKASEMLFRTGIFSWIIILICDVLAAWGLYILLKPVNKGLSLLMAWFRLVYAAILGTALLNFVNVLSFISNSDNLAAFGTDLLQSNVLLSVNAFNDSWSMGLLVFGIHIYFLGYLILKSGYIPKIFGVLLIVAFLGYLITNSANVLFYNYENYKTVIELIFIIPMLGEVGLGVWLLLKARHIPDMLTEES